MRQHTRQIESQHKTNCPRGSNWFTNERQEKTKTRKKRQDEAEREDKTRGVDTAITETSYSKKKAYDEAKKDRPKRETKIKTESHTHKRPTCLLGGSHSSSESTKAEGRPCQNLDKTPVCTYKTKTKSKTHATTTVFFNTIFCTCHLATHALTLTLNPNSNSAHGEWGRKEG